MRRLVAFVAFLALAACGGDSTSPSASLAGNWSGTIVSRTAGSGTVTMTMLQSGSSLSGTWNTTFSNSSYNNSGTLSGSVSGSQIAASLTSSVPTACGSNIAGALSGTTITGTYAAANCSVAESGTFSITKQ